VQYLRTWFDSHKVNVGGEFRRNFRQEQRNFDQEDYLDSDESSTVWALFAQDEWRLGEDVRLSIGVRHDHYSTFGSSTNPRLAVVWNPAEKTALKALYGTAFRAPNAYELYYEDGGYSQNAPEALDAETIRTYELVWEQYVGDHLRSALSGFYYNIENLITLGKDPADVNQEGDPLLVYENRGGARVQGIETELEGKWPGGAEGRVSYTYQLARDEESGSWLVNSPRHLAKLNLSAPLFTELLRGGVEVQYTSKRKTFQGETVDGFWVANLTLLHSGWIKGLELSGSIYNLFDREYEDPGSAEHLQNGIEQDGRALRVKASYLF
jgi:iron complex outermembrane receptor protein